MEVSSHSQLRDVCTRCFLQLPSDVDQLWTIGLTVTEELSGCVSQQIYSSDLVVVFFSLHTRYDGHWVTPHPDLPLLLNGEEICVTALLSHGSVLMVGGHTLTYNKSTDQDPDSKSIDKSESIAAVPPPKPKRSKTTTDYSELEHPQEQHLFTHSTRPDLFDATLKMPEILTAKYDDVNHDADFEKSMEIFMSLKASIINNDIELLSHIETPEQVIGVCMSYLVQFCISHGLALSAREVDVLCKVINHVWILQPQSLFEFLGGMKTKEIISEHDVSPFLKLVADLLLWSMDSEPTSEVCLKAISHLSEDPRICNIISKHSIISLISACMSVYPNNVLIQTLTCRVYANVLEEWRPSSKCPLREAAVDFIVRAVKLHSHERPFLRVAFRALAALLTKQGLKNPNSQINSNSVLDHIEQSALPVVEEMARSHEDDISIHQYCNEILNYFAMRTPRSSLDKSFQMDQQDRLCQNDDDSVHYEDINLSDSSDECSAINTNDVQTSIEVSNDYITIIADDNIGTGFNPKHIYAQAIKNKSPYSAELNLIDNDVYEEGFMNSTQNEVSDDTKDPTSDMNLIDNEAYEQSFVESAQNSNVNDFPEGSGDMYEEVSKDHSTGKIEAVNASKQLSKTVDSPPELISKPQKVVEKQISINQSSQNQPPAKKTSKLKKKFDKYFNKLKPGNKKKVDISKQVPEPDHQERTNNYVQFDQFDNSIDIGYTNRDTVDEKLTKNEPKSDDVINDYDNANLKATPQDTAEDDETESVDSEFQLKDIPQSDSDSVASEFRLDQKAFQFSNNSSSSIESFGKPQFSQSNHSSMESFSKFRRSSTNRSSRESLSKYQALKDTHSSMDRVTSDSEGIQIHLNSANSSRSSSKQSLNSTSSLVVSNRKGRRLSASTVSITSQTSTSSDLSNTSKFDVRSLPGSRSEYADHIQKSLEARTGKKEAWVKTLKKIYEKPTKKPSIVKGLSSKSCSNLYKIGRRYSLVENPKYMNSEGEMISSPRKLSTCKSVENLMNISTTSIEEENDVDVKHEEQSEKNIDTVSSNSQNSRSSLKRHSKFEELKMKNQRTKLERFPWHSNKSEN